MGRDNSLTQPRTVREVNFRNLGMIISIAIMWAIGAGLATLLRSM